MDEPGIRFQVAPALLMAGSTLLLSIVLTPHLGAIGPLLGNSFAVLAFQVIPFIFYIRRHRERLYSPTPKEPAAVVVDPTTAG
jgi:O-antigen/teichoic acid export membrane protein